MQSRFLNFFRTTVKTIPKNLNFSRSFSSNKFSPPQYPRPHLPLTLDRPSIGYCVRSLHKWQEIREIKKIRPDEPWLVIDPELEKKTLKKLLILGEDPNGYPKTLDGFFAPIVEAYRVEDKSVLGLLLQYQADLHRKGPFSCYRLSPTQYLSSYANEILNSDYIKTEFDNNYAYKSTTIKPPIPKIYCRYHSESDFTININLTLPNGKEVYSTTMPYFLPKKDEFKNILGKPDKACSQTEKDLKSIYAIFATSFKTSAYNPNTLEDEFYDDLQSGLLNIIRSDDNKIIGFISYQYRDVTHEDKNYFIFDYKYSALLAPSEYRETSFMQFYMFAMPYAVQKILKDKIVSSHFSTLHYNSYRWLEHMISFPQYQPPHIVSLFKKLCKFEYQHNDMMIYTMEGIEANVPLVRSKTAQNKAGLFYHEFMGLKSLDSTLGRAVPVIIINGLENFFDYTLACQGLGFDMAAFISQLANTVTPVFNAFHAKQDDAISCAESSFLPSRNTEFWGDPDIIFQALEKLKRR